MIEVILKKDNKHKSLVQIKKGEDIIYLTEKELPLLVEDLYEKRRDLFENIPVLQIKSDEVADLKEDIQDLESTIGYCKDRISYLEDILNEEDIEY